MTVAYRVFLLLLCALSVIGLLTRPASAAPCDWEYGGVVEAVPEPCPTPLVVDMPAEGSELEGWRAEMLLGLGVLVFVGVGSFVGSWGRRG